MPGGLRPARPAGAELLVITTSGAEQSRQFFSKQNIACPVLLQKDMALARAYQAQGTPTGYLINAEGKISSELAVVRLSAPDIARAEDDAGTWDQGHRRSVFFQLSRFNS